MKDFLGVCIIVLSVVAMYFVPVVIFILFGMNPVGALVCGIPSMYVTSELTIFCWSSWDNYQEKKKAFFKAYRRVEL